MGSIIDGYTIVKERRHVVALSCYNSVNLTWVAGPYVGIGVGQNAIS